MADASLFITNLSEDASRERWAEERALRGVRVSEKVLAAAEINQVEELAAFDSDCLRQARQVIGTVNIVLSQHRRPYELCALARAFESAQRIGRLALGASTQTVHTDPYAQMTDQELAAELERLGIEPTVQ
ncbi:MAG TPA: hypothetical protein VF783_08565 [Terriglobales bacterium]